MAAQCGRHVEISLRFTVDRRFPRQAFEFRHEIVGALELALRCAMQRHMSDDNIHALAARSMAKTTPMYEESA